MKLSLTKEYMIKSVRANCEARGGFVWPCKRGSVVTAPDWSVEPQCGNGLHGLYRGVGDADLLCYDTDAIWFVLEVDPSEVVNLNGKVKVPKCKVAYIGNRETAVSLIKERYPENPVPFCTAMVGDRGTATAGYRGRAMAGKGGTAMVGDRGTATAGDYGAATAWNDGTATAGNWGTATVGNRSTATTGYGGTATAGYEGIIQIKYWDSEKNRPKIKTGYIGENGLLPNVPYKLNNQNEFVRADKEEK